MRRVVLSLLLLVSARSALAVDLSGRWEIQSMGADREVIIQHKGGKLVARRTMWPEFEGEKYKLEHMYRGTVSGSTIKGELLVKEPELKGFEILRDFTGSVGGMGELTLDGLPLKKLDAASVAPAAGETAVPEGGARPSEPPAVSRAEPAVDPTDIAAVVSMPRQALDLMAAGDELLANGKPRPALARYEQAAKSQGGSKAALLHRLGKCHLGLKQYTRAKDFLKRALRLDPSNRIVQDDYEKAKALAG